MPGAGCACFTGGLVKLEGTTENSHSAEAEKSCPFSPGSLQSAVTPVGQFPTWIPRGNEALNLFSWKQLVVSQLQMPTCVLSARLLAECWIDFLTLSVLVLRNPAWEGRWGRVGFVFVRVLFPLWWRQKRRSRHCCRYMEAGAGRAEDASFWVCLVSWDLMPSTSGFSALPETPSSLSLCCWSWNNVVVNSNSQIKEMYIFKKRDEIIFERV